MNNTIYDFISKDITFRRYEMIKEQLSKAIAEKDTDNVASLQTVLRYQQKELHKVFDYLLDLDISNYNGKISYLIASEEDKKYMNPDGSTNYKAISQMCDFVDKECEVITNGKEL